MDPNTCETWASLLAAMTPPRCIQVVNAGELGVGEETWALLPMSVSCEFVIIERVNF